MIYLEIVPLFWQLWITCAHFGYANFPWKTQMAYFSETICEINATSTAGRILFQTSWILFPLGCLIATALIHQIIPTNTAEEFGLLLFSFLCTGAAVVASLSIADSHTDIHPYGVSLWIATGVGWRFMIHGLIWVRIQKLSTDAIIHIIIQVILWFSGLLFSVLFVAIKNGKAWLEWASLEIFSVAVFHMVVSEYFFNHIKLIERATF